MVTFRDPMNLVLPYDVQEIHPYRIAFAGSLWPARFLDDGREFIPGTRVFVVSKYPGGYALHKGAYNRMVWWPIDKLTETEPGVLEVIEDVALGLCSLMRMTGSVTDTPLVNVNGVGIRRLVPADVSDFGFFHYRDDGTLLAEPVMLALPNRLVAGIGDVAVALQGFYADHVNGQRIAARLIGALAKVTTTLADLPVFTANHAMDCRMVPQAYRTALAKILQALEDDPVHGNSYLLIQAHHILRHLLDRTPGEWNLRVPALDVQEGIPML